MDDRIIRGAGHQRTRMLLATVALLVAFCIVAVATFCIATVPTNLLVSGPSMCPTMWGPSRQFTCGTCGWQTRVVEVGELSPTPPLCFRCGRREANVLSGLEIGDQVQLVRTAYWFDDPEINDLVAIKKSDSDLQVKRVIGKPGDVVKIDDHGQVFINNVIWRPPYITDQLDLSRPGIEVYDHDETLGDASRLKLTGGWFVYEHRDIHNRGKAGQIRDDNPANMRLRRVTLPIDHLFVLMEVRSTAAATLDVICALADKPVIEHWIVQPGRQQIVAEFDQGEWKLLAGSVRSDEAAKAELQIDGLELSLQRPIAVRINGGGDVVLETFWLGRGVRFDPPRELQNVWLKGVQVPEDRLLVLGDNAPASEDSRHQPECVEISRIAGKVKLAPAD